MYEQKMYEQKKAKHRLEKEEKGEKGEKEYPEEGEVVLCTVKDIKHTQVFLTLDEYNLEGVMQFSEVASGRIRNIRDYVVPGKKVVCKILRVEKEKKHIDLSLRRVSAKERDEVMKKYMHEQNIKNLLKVILRENFEMISNKILEKYKNFSTFIDEILKNPDEGEKLGMSRATINEILEEVKKRLKVKKIISIYELKISTLRQDGILLIKDFLRKLSNEMNVKINYISAPRYAIVLEGKNQQEVSKKAELIEKFLANYSKDFDVLSLEEKKS